VLHCRLVLSYSRAQARQVGPPPQVPNCLPSGGQRKRYVIICPIGNITLICAYICTYIHTYTYIHVNPYCHSFINLSKFLRLLASSGAHGFSVTRLPAMVVLYQPYGMPHRVMHSVSCLKHLFTYSQTRQIEVHPLQARVAPERIRRCVGIETRAHRVKHWVGYI
jgi:hypothetical protein